MIDSIYILSLEHDKPRRQRLLKLIQGESNPNLIKSTKLVKGINSSQIDDHFLKSNNLDYYKNWKLSEKECLNIAKKYSKKQDSVKYGPCEMYYNVELKKGQLACLLGHIECWKQMILNNDDYAIVFEDDAWWNPNKCLSYELEELFSLKLSFDLFFLGRTPLIESEEVGAKVNPKKYVIPNYSYNSHAYILSRQGCLKLLSQNPHKNLLSADEFLASCYCFHPREDLRNLFPKCLDALALKEELIIQMNTEEIARTEGITWSNVDISEYVK